jgi:2-polyprenyl-3-methyl-5-hydroxy-6-metoxy-1,4-benzoquinol methylase
LNRLPAPMLREMARRLRPEDRDEMAVPSYLHPNPALRWMAWRRVEVIARRLALACPMETSEARTVLDFGCGTGVLLGEAHARAGRVIGVDPVLDAARMLVEAERLARVVLLTPEQAFAQVAPASVDVAIAAEVLEHIEPLEPTLAFLRSCLKPGGKLLVSLPTESRLYRLGRKLAGFSGHYHHANAESVDLQIVAAGFRRTHLERIPLPGPLSIYWVIDYVDGAVSNRARVV